MLVIFLSALAVGFSGAMMPGSLLTYTIRKSMSNGARAGFIIATGHAVLEMVLILLIFMGFDTILKTDAAQIAIGIAGGLMLVYMGFGMIINSLRDKVSITLDDGSTGRSGMLVSGFIISAANPYFILWWAVVGLGFIMQSYNSLGFLGVIIYYIGHIMADFIWYGFVSVIVGTTRKFLNHKIYRTLIAVLGALLVFFGGRFVYEAIIKMF
ncbi:MAG: LysE family transporter [Acetivibrionales bacterium]|jgi:threonine/homoserine/homoserine lactone efflux protein